MFQVPYATVFVFRDFNVHHKDWLNYSGGTDRHGELYYNSSISNDLLRWLTFLRGSLTVTITILLLWISICSDASIYSTRPFLHWEILMLLFQFPFTFHQTQNGMPCFIV